MWLPQECVTLHTLFRRKTTYQDSDRPDKDLDPVVQSVVSLTSSLRVISLTVSADSIYNILLYFAEKCV